MSPTDAQSIIEIADLHLYFGSAHVLRGVTLPIKRHRITALIGPSGAGKSSLLRCLNRMIDLTEEARTEGTISFLGQDVLSGECDVVQLRQDIGMVFQKPNPFPRSIFDNVAYGPRIRGRRNRAHLTEVVETSLKKAALWEEVKDRLQADARQLSGGQQQRLCIARSLAVRPQILLMDEPCSALDPEATLRIENLLDELSDELTLVVVTHNLQQAGRISDDTAFLLDGELIETGPTDEIFTNAGDPRTDRYVTGRFG